MQKLLALQDDAFWRFSNIRISIHAHVAVRAHGISTIIDIGLLRFRDNQPHRIIEVVAKLLHLGGPLHLALTVA